MLRWFAVESRATALQAAATALASSLVISAQAPQRPPGFTERVDVARIIVDARVVDADGGPMLGLRADDFRVKIDGKPVHVDSAAWIGGEAQPDQHTLDSLRPVDSPPSPQEGRLIVFLFQKSLEPSRIIGDTHARVGKDGDYSQISARVTARGSAAHPAPPCSRSRHW